MDKLKARKDDITVAFARDNGLITRIRNAINETPQYAPLFHDIAQYCLNGLEASQPTGSQDEITNNPSKKRKIEGGSSTVNGSQADQPRTTILEARDISFALPQRKKFHLSIVQYGQDFDAANTTFAICATNPASNQVEFEYPTSLFAYVVRVSVPEKAQKQYNFCLLPSTQPQSTPALLSPGEGVIWTVNHGPLKSCHIHSDELRKLAPGPDDILENALNAVLRRSENKLILPTDVEFSSSIVEAHRKNDKAYHVKAFRGSKDGFLYFLENGIFFGFKKPLAFFPFHDIDSISYTAVLQRTFNLIIIVRTAADAQEQEIEFSMLDQADFAGIDAYLKNHQLQDSSMAEARRAKQYKVNGAKGDAAGGDENDARTEIQKAEEELEDEEDELEEDYDPGSDGESEGSGSSEDDDDEYEYAASGSKKDLVKDELGSEAEDVEIEEEEGEEEEGEEDDYDEEEEMIEDQPVVAPSTTTAEVRVPAPQRPRTVPGAPEFDDEDQL